MKNDPAVRQHFIENNFDKSVAAYRNARERGGKDPVVLILDLRDTMARRVVGLVKDEGYIREALHYHGQRDEIATVIMAVERQVASEVLSNFSPSARTAMESNLPLLACVASGGTTYAVMEVGR